MYSFGVDVFDVTLSQVKVPMLGYGSVFPNRNLSNFNCDVYEIRLSYWLIVQGTHVSNFHGDDFMSKKKSRQTCAI